MSDYNAVEPPHYQRGPQVKVPVPCDADEGDWVLYSIQAIDVMRHIQDPRLATAFRYLWRVAFSGKKPDQGQSQMDKNMEDIKKAQWYLKDYLNFSCEEPDTA